MEKREWILWGVIGVLVISVVYILTNMPEQKDSSVALQKTGYVDVVKVFGAFEMKQELQEKLESELYGQQATLDSLMFQLQSLNNELGTKPEPSNDEIQKFQSLQGYYMQQKQLFDEYSQDLTAKYDAQILDQLNQYIKDYGFNNGYDYVFGATGDGNILYGAEPADITEEVIKFINDSYQGKN